ASDDGQPRPRDVVPPPVSRRRVAPVRAGHAVDVERPRPRPRSHLPPRRCARHLGDAGRPDQDGAMTTRNRRIAAIVLVIAAVAAIAIFRGRGSSKTASRAPATTAGASTSTAPPTSPSLQAVTLTLTQLATVENPTAISARPNDTSLYVVEQPGRVRRLARNGDTFALDATPVVDIRNDV